MKQELEKIMKEKNLFDDETKSLGPDSFEFNALPKEFIAYFFVFEVNTTIFSLKHEERDMMVFEMKDFFVEAGMRPSSLYAKLKISSTLIQEKIINSIYFPNIMEGEYLEIIYDTLPSTSISMQSGGISITGNFESIFHVSGILSEAMQAASEDLTSQYMQTVSSKTAEYMDFGEKYFKDVMKNGIQQSISLDINLKAPLICIPLDIQSMDSGMLIIDLGKLSASSSAVVQNNYNYDKYSFVFREMRACIV